MGEPSLCYLVCATQRSGSTLLCELLKDTGVAGRPEEYFEAERDTGVPPHPGFYLRGTPRTGAGVRDDPEPAQAPAYSSLAGIADYGEHLRRTFADGTTDNGVFGAKLMYNQLPELQALAGTLPAYAGLTDHELLTRLFHNPRYVWVRRRDTVRQAVSLWKALQNRRWRGGDDDEPARTGDQLQYRFEGIDHLVRWFDDHDAGWQRRFTGHGIEPLTVSYEDDLLRDPERTVRSALRFLGVDAPADWRPRPATQRQADEVSEQWVARYRREADR